jgi:hypothetical protein
MGGQHHAPAALPPGKTQYPLYSRLGGPQGRSGRCGISRPHRDSIPGPSSSFASRYTDCAIAAHICKGKGKGKLSPLRTVKACRIGKGIAPFILNLNARWKSVCVCVCVCGQIHTPAALPPGKNSGTQLIGSCLGPQHVRTFCRIENLLLLPVFEPRTVLPVASRYTKS